MKVSKINEHSIECLLTSEELFQLGATAENLIDGTCEKLDDILITAIDAAYSGFGIKLVEDIEKDEILYTVNQDSDSIKIIVEKANQIKESNIEQENDTIEQLHNENEYVLMGSFSFKNLNEVIDISKYITTDLKNSLYKFNNKYELIIMNNSQSTSIDFANLILSLFDYCESSEFDSDRICFLKEHGKCIIQDNAIQSLSQI